MNTKQPIDIQGALQDIQDVFEEFQELLIKEFNEPHRTIFWKSVKAQVQIKAIMKTMKETYKAKGQT